MMSEAPEPNPYEPPGPAITPAWRSGQSVAAVTNWVTLGGLVLVSSGIAFVATCLPVGAVLITPVIVGHGDPAVGRRGLAVACLVGSITAIVAGYLVVRSFRRRNRREP